MIAYGAPWMFAYMDTFCQAKLVPITADGSNIADDDSLLNTDVYVEVTLPAQPRQIRQLRTSF